MRKRYRVLTVLAVVLLGCALLFKLNQAHIGMTLFERAVAARVGVDITKRLPDGLHVALCGTGSPLPNPARAGPCQIVIAGNQLLVVDIGEGGARNLNLMGVPIGRIQALFLTHFHSDHIDGMGPLMIARWTSGSSRLPLPVFGPTGVEEVVAGFNAAYRPDQGYRTRHHGVNIVPPEGAGWRARPFALAAPGTSDMTIVYEQDGLRVTAVRVDHGPVEPAVGYRFDYKGRSLVISGDTKASSALARAARGADLMIHEALQPKMVGVMTSRLDASGAKGLAQITRDILNYHSSPEDAAGIAKAAGVKQLVLSHIVPSLPAGTFNTIFLGDAASRFDGQIIIGEDGMLFSLPAGRSSITRERLM